MFFQLIHFQNITILQPRKSLDCHFNRLTKTVVLFRYFKNESLLYA